MKYEIGSRIRNYREESHLSQKQLAARIGVNNSRVSNWEQGINRPDADIFATVCVAPDVSPSLLLGIHVSGDELTIQEYRVLRAYREKREVRQAIHILLGIPEDNQSPNKRTMLSAPC